MRSVENALGMEIPLNAQYIRNLIMGAHAVHDHIVHFYHLCALDWVDIVSALSADARATAKLGQSLSPWKRNSYEEIKGAQDRLKALVDSGQLGIYGSGYWGHPAMKLAPEVNLLAATHYLQALEYQRNINKGLDKALMEAPVFPLEIEQARLIIFSDHHKGKGDEADDFRFSMPSYISALDHYLTLGHSLIVLGDVEELWENSPGPVLDHYASVLESENEFHKLKRYWRFWGNHDDEWRNPSQVKKHLGKYFKDITVRESLRLQIFDAEIELGEIILAQ